MLATVTSAAFERRRMILSTLWIFVVLNYIYADVFTLFFNPVLQPAEAKRFAGDMAITQGFVLVAALLMQTAIVMVLLARVLPYRANRWANILSAAFHTLFVGWSLIGESVNLFYVMFVVIEVATTLFIVWYAWKWPAPGAEPVKAGAARPERGEYGAIR